MKTTQDEGLEQSGLKTNRKKSFSDRCRMCGEEQIQVIHRFFRCKVILHRKYYTHIYYSKCKLTQHWVRKNEIEIQQIVTEINDPPSKINNE